MESDQMLVALFVDEDRARAMARRLMDLANADPPAAATERGALLEFLRVPLERHFAYEERVIFPRLSARGLGEEVLVAQKHHASIREAAATLAAAEGTEAVARQVFRAAQLVLHHTNFEGDYIYPELTRGEWNELLRESLDQH